MEDYSRPLRVCLAFLALSPQERLQLLPDAWTQPMQIDNGYAFLAEQPRHVMADFCQEWLRLQECWEDIPAYTGLALQPTEAQVEAEALLKLLRQHATEWHWHRWAESEADCAAASALLSRLAWKVELSQKRLYAELDKHTYGTFSAAFHNPKV